MGFGWTLGFGSIERSLIEGVPTYVDSTDVFLFNGEKLLEVPPGSGTFHTSREGFLRIRRVRLEAGTWIADSTGNTWEVRAKDGTVSLFGTNSNSRIERPGGGTHTWLLAEIIDTHDNGIAVLYDRRDPGTAYPATVRYGLRRNGSQLESLNPSNPDSIDRVVRFILEDIERPDVSVRYIAGFEQILAHRLEQIDVSVGGSLTRRIVLEYGSPSPDSFRSLLREIHEFGADADDANPTPPRVSTFEYRSNVADGTTGWIQVAGWSLPPNVWFVEDTIGFTFSDFGTRIGDVNGDGLPDLIRRATYYASGDANSVGPLQNRPFNGVYLNTGAGFSPTPSPGLSPPFSTRHDHVTVGDFVKGRRPVTTIIDVNGDGRADGVRADNWTNYWSTEWHQSSGYFEYWENSPGGWVLRQEDIHDDDGNVYPPGIAPSNGNLGFGSTSFGAFMNRGLKGYSFVHNHMAVPGLCGIPQFFQQTVDGRTQIGDLNGDGRPDLLTNHVLTWVQPNNPTVVISNETERTYSLAASDGSGFGPVMSDRFSVCSDNSEACLRDAMSVRHFVHQPTTNCPRFTGYSGVARLGKRLIDVNGDGLSDQVMSLLDGSTLVRQVYINDGEDFVRDDRWIPPIAFDSYDGPQDFSNDRGVRFGDVNGDGREDIISAKEGQPTQVWLSTGNPNSPWVLAPSWSLPVSMSFVEQSEGRDLGARIADLDGDGMIDLIRAYDVSPQQALLNEGEVPDLLMRSVTPLGAVTTFDYTPSTAFDNTGGNAPDLPRILSLVTSVSVDDANGTVQTTTLDYEGGVFDPAERELRGFRRVTATRGADERTTTTFYHQDAARAGLIESVEIRNGAGVLFARTERTYTPDADGVAPYTSLLASERRLEYDGQTEPRLSLTTYTYDGGGALTLGNLTATTEYGEVSSGGGDVDPADTRTSELQYALPGNPTQATPYLVDRVAVSRVRAGASPGSGAVLRESLFFYDGDLAGGAPPSLGDLTQRIDVLAEAGFPDPTTRFVYDAFGNVSEISRPRAVAGEVSGVVSIEYDPLYHTFPAALVNELGHRSELSYATPPECEKAHSPGAGLVHEASDPNALAAGESILRCYDAFGRLARERAPAGLAETNYTYIDTPGSAGVAISQLAHEGGGQRSTNVWLDGLGRVISTYGQGPQSQYVQTGASYDAAGRLATRTAPRFAGSPDPLQVTSYDYDVLDRLVQTTLPGVARVRTLDYDQELLTETDANGIVTNFSLDPFGRVIQVEEVGGAGSPVTHYFYDPLGQLTQVTDSGGNQTDVEYDLLGRKTRLQDPDTGENVYLYDPNGNLVFQGTPLGATAWVYDALDRPLTRVPTTGQGVNWFYDTAANGIGRLAEENRTPLRYRALTYDLLGRPVHERFVPSTVSNDPSHETVTAYDPLGQIASRGYPNGALATWQRDARGFVTSIVTGSGETYASQIQSDAQGRLARWTTGAGASEERTFDATTGRLEEISIEGAAGEPFEHVEYGYDPGDRVTTVTDLLNGSRNRSFGYDARGRLTSATGPYGENAAPATRYYKYDALGNLVGRDMLAPALFVGAGAVFTYPAPGPGIPRPHAPIDSSLGAVAHDAAGNLTQLGPRGYEYDLDSQLVRVRDAGALRASMFYDGTGRLVRLTDAATGHITYRIAPDFEWNASTNRAQIRIELAGRVIAVHDLAHDPNYVPPSCSGSPSAATRVDPAGFAGLFAPGLAALLGLALLQARRRRVEALAVAISHGGAAARPMAPGWRVGIAATTGGIFVLVISIPVPLLGPSTANAVSPASVVYYHGDHLASSVVATGDVPSPGLLRHVVYRPYGGVVAESAGGSTEPPEVGFTGQRFEEAAGIYDYGARWYDSQMGRFLQPDSIVPEPFNPQSLNRYSYVMNDPVNRIDPTGNTSETGGYLPLPVPSFERPSVTIDPSILLSNPANHSTFMQPDSTILPHPGGAFEPTSQSGLSGPPVDPGPWQRDVPFFDFGELGNPATEGIPWVIGGKLFTSGLRWIGARLFGRAALTAEQALARGAVNPRIYAQLQKQLGEAGEESIRTALRSARSALQTHVDKLNQLRTSGGYTSQVEGTIRNVSNQIRTLEKFIGDHGL